jgi:hypothetical protein
LSPSKSEIGGNNGKAADSGLVAYRLTLTQCEVPDLLLKRGLSLFRLSDAISDFASVENAHASLDDDQLFVFVDFGIIAAED